VDIAASMTTGSSGCNSSAAAQTQTATDTVALADIGALDFSQILQELDSDGDGEISEQEFADYRSAKQASGEYIPMDGPGTSAARNAPVDNIIQNLFQSALDDDQSET
jgi:hypothetical protein